MLYTGSSVRRSAHLERIDVFSKDKNDFGSPSGKSRSKEMLLNSSPGLNEF